MKKVGVGAAFAAFRRLGDWMGHSLESLFSPMGGVPGEVGRQWITRISYLNKVNKTPLWSLRNKPEVFKTTLDV